MIRKTKRKNDSLYQTSKNNKIRWDVHEKFIVNDQGPTWSPDGSKIVFESQRDGTAEIYVMNPDGSGQTRLTTNLADNGEPAWSPDGSKIFIHSFLPGMAQLYTMNTDGSGQTRITFNPPLDSDHANSVITC